MTPVRLAKMSVNVSDFDNRLMVLVIFQEITSYLSY